MSANLTPSLFWDSLPHASLRVRLKSTMEAQLVFVDQTNSTATQVTSTDLSVSEERTARGMCDDGNAANTALADEENVDFLGQTQKSGHCKRRL